MLTVLYKDERGGEHLFEAESVQRVSRSPLHEPKDGFDYEPGVLINLSEDRRVHYGETTAVSNGDTMRQVFVMNRFGATVARYPL